MLDPVYCLNQASFFSSTKPPSRPFPQQKEQILDTHNRENKNLKQVLRQKDPKKKEELWLGLAQILMGLCSIRLD